MGTWWIVSLAGGMIPFLGVLLSFVRVCVMLIKIGRRWLPEDGISFSTPTPRHGGVSSDVEGRVEVFI